MAVVSVEISSRSIYADGREIGSFGQFERLDGTLHYAVDPLEPHNSCICDIDLAPRDGNGMVLFSGDFTLIAPLSKSPRCLLLEVPNRGNHISFRMFNRSSFQDSLKDPCSAGDGFLFRHGIALLSVGWQFDAIGKRLSVPEALQDGKQITGEVVCQFQPATDTSDVHIGQLGPATYQPHSDGNCSSTMYERTHTHAAHKPIDSSMWGFGKIGGGGVESSIDHVWNQDGFRKGRIYTLVYRAQGASVVGLGMLALRDAASFFRSSKYIGKTPPAPHVVAFGASQTGRVLRHMLYENLMVSEEGGVAIDGVLPHIAGGQRGDFNHRFAQPSSVGVPAIGQTFPFAGATSTDTHSGTQDSLYSRITNMPKVVITNTAWEYWRGDAALSHMRTDGLADIETVPEERQYYFAGTHHINAIVPYTDKLSMSNERVRYGLNTVSYSPLIRATLLNLIDWVEGKTVPPPSTVPRIDDGTLVPRELVLDRFERTGRFKFLPDSEALPGLSSLDLGPRARNGICKFPAGQGQRYPGMVCNVDENLNETSGIRLPDLQVPLGCHTGWNPRHSDHGAEDQIAQFVGFSRFESSMVEKFTRASYLDQCRLVIDQLIDERFVLKEDRDLLVDTASIRFGVARRHCH